MLKTVCQVFSKEIFYIFTLINISGVKKISKLLFVSLAGAALVACSLRNEQEVTVHGIIGRLDNSRISITYTNPGNELRHDTVTTSESGKFDFRVPVASRLNTITIRFIDKNSRTTLFANPGDDITIKGSIEYVDLLTIKGGAVNDDLNRFKKQISTLYKERLDLLKRPYKNDKLTEVRLAEIDLFLKREAKNFIRENPSSIASVVLIQDFFYQDYDPSTAELLSILQGDATRTHMAQKMRNSLRFR